MKAVQPTCLSLLLLYANHITALQAEPIHQKNAAIYVQTSLADLVDKIVILRIKQQRIRDSTKLANINEELELLLESYDKAIEQSEELTQLETQLLEANKALWDLEDTVRLKEQTHSFDQEFVRYVAAILTHNDERACIKRSINLIGQSPIVEEKSYRHIKELPITRSCNTHVKPAAYMCIIPLALAELVDRITILAIKKEYIHESEKVFNILREYEILTSLLARTVPCSDTEFMKLYTQLFEANKKMWEIQDALRKKQINESFDEEFIELGRSVYYTNDARCAIKRNINLLYGSALIEEKSYTTY